MTNDAGGLNGVALRLAEATGCHALQACKCGAIVRGWVSGGFAQAGIGDSPESLLRVQLITAHLEAGILIDAVTLADILSGHIGGNQDDLGAKLGLMAIEGALQGWPVSEGGHIVVTICECCKDY